jgi:hypothetical protein
MIRDVKEGTQGQKLGKAATGEKGKPREVSRVRVYPCDRPLLGTVTLRMDSAGARPVFLHMQNSLALEIVKGILGNVAHVSIAVDDELRSIIQGAVERAEAEASAVVACLKDVGRLPPEAQAPTPQDSNHAQLDVQAPSVVKEGKCKDCGTRITVESREGVEPGDLCQKCDPAFAMLLDNKWHQAKESWLATKGDSQPG